MQTPTPALQGSGLFARVLRSSAFVAGGFVLGQGMRLASNLILTRLLYPEAFGIMALITMIMVGLTMFSDVGIGPAIMSSKRADEPRWLDTAWTLQVLRGAVLWAIICALAYPVALFYDSPELVQILPVAGFSLVLAGFNPTRIETANRHLALGRVTALDLASQALGIGAMVVMALATSSIWSLVWGGLVGVGSKLVLTTLFLPGHRNRFAWDKSSASELLHYGGWILLSTACGFMLLQGDKAILGRYLSLESLGIYNVGYFLASFPMMLTAAVMGRVFIPLYREYAEQQSRALSDPAAGGAARAATQRQKLRKMRFGMTGLIFAMLTVMALAGVWLIGLLYDARYVAAGAVVTAIACVQLPSLVVASYDQSALAAGDSKGFFTITAIKAVGQTLGIWLGAELGGLTGALIGQGLSALLIAAPASMMLARRHKVQDPLHDAVFLTASLVLLATVFATQSQDVWEHLTRL